MACFYPKCKNNDFSQASGRLDAGIMWLWKSESGRRLDIRPSGHEKIERAEEEEEKKKKDDVQKKCFCFLMWRNAGRRTLTDKWASSAYVKTRRRSVTMSRITCQHCLWLQLSIMRNFFLPPPSVSPSSHSVYPPLYQLPSHHFILSLHGAILKRRVRLGLDCFLFLFLFRESRRTASGSRRRHSRNSFCLAPPIEPQRHLKRSQRNQAAVKMFRISFIEKYRLFCITRRKKQRP